MLASRSQRGLVSTLLVLLLLTVSLPAVLAFDCRLDLPSSKNKGKEVHFDLGSLDGEHSASKTTETPPTTNEAKVRLRICGDEGLKRDGDVAEEDQCPDGTKVCLTLLNHKSSSSEGVRVTAVIPIWSTSTPEDDIKVTTREDDQGLDIVVNGDQYAGGPQRLKLHLVCSDPSDTDPTFDSFSYSEGTLIMTWSSPDACPKAADGSEDVPTPEEKASTSGSGVGRFFKFVFWMLFFGLFFYFVIGVYYNYTTYGSRGLDLLPHKDFWVDLPTMMGDLFSHIASNVRGGSSSGTSRRSGYTSLG